MGNRFHIAHRGDVFAFRNRSTSANARRSWCLVFITIPALRKLRDHLRLHARDGAVAEPYGLGDPVDATTSG
jgi:hypothetical protein